METQQTPFQMDLPSQCVDLMLAEVTLNKLINRKKAAERETVQLLSELCIANDKAKELAFQIEEAKGRAMAFKREFSLTSHPGTDTDGVQQILREVDDVKQKICSIKLDLASASVQIERARIQIQLIDSECKSYSGHSKVLRREIEATSIEKEFIDLDRSEVEREIKQIKASHEEEAANFAERMEKTNSRIIQLQKEISAAKKLHKKIVITTSEVNALQHEMEFLRSMEKKSEKTRYVKDEQEEVNLSSLQSSRAELEAAKEELSGLKEEGFRIMDAMDEARKELMQIAEEKEQCNKAVKGSESRLEILDTKLHKAMSKMESASKAERRADAIVSSLAAALGQLHSDIEAAKRETELLREETKAVRTQTEDTRSSRTASVEERFGDAMEELKHVTASETMALEELQAVTESTMTERAISSLWSDTITISKFEYYYLLKQGKAAQEVAEKKVAAALAWKESLEAKAKEEKERAKVEREREEKWAIVKVDQKRGTTKPKRRALNCNCKQGPEEEDYVTRSSHHIKLAIAMPRRSLNASGITVKVQRPEIVEFAEKATELHGYGSEDRGYTKKKKKGKVMEKVVKVLNDRRGRQSIKA